MRRVSGSSSSLEGDSPQNLIMVGMSVRGKAGFVRPTATRINRLTPVPDISMEDIIQDASEGESTDYDSDTVEASNPPTARGSDPEDVFSDTDVDELSEEDRSSPKPKAREEKYELLVVRERERERGV